jgi:hypothetical protein
MNVTIFHLMDFKEVQQYQLRIIEGPYTSDSWEVLDEADQPIQGIISYSLTSDSVSEAHKIVLTRTDQTQIELAVIGLSICRIPPTKDPN